MTLYQLLTIFSLTLAVILFYLLTMFNSLVRLRNRVRTLFSDIDIQLRRRAALLQNLVDLVREYTSHEEKTFTGVAKARAAVDNSRGAHQSAKADNMLTETLRSLMMVTEAYPELKADANFKELRRDLLDAENAIAEFRQSYNKGVETYNNAIQIFPNMLVAALFGFEPEELFEPSPTDEAPIKKS